MCVCVDIAFWREGKGRVGRGIFAARGQAANEPTTHLILVNGLVARPRSCLQYLPVETNARDGRGRQRVQCDSAGARRAGACGRLRGTKALAAPAPGLGGPVGLCSAAARPGQPSGRSSPRAGRAASELVDFDRCCFAAAAAAREGAAGKRPHLGMRLQKEL